MQLDASSERVAALVAEVGRPGLPAALAAFLRGIAPYDYTVVFGYRGAARPLDLFDDFPAAKRNVFVGDYQAGPYLLDPFYLAATRPVAPGLYRLRSVAPDRFYQGEYFRSYYQRTGLAEEIGYFVAIAGRAMVVLSLMRTERVFAAREFTALERVWPVVRAAVERHWADLPARFDAPPQPERAFHSFAEGVLTPRERQVVEYTLKGYSAEAAGRALGIAPGTVRIHRRNIYAKLGIGSQGELFARFFGAAGPRR